MMKMYYCVSMTEFHSDTFNENSMVHINNENVPISLSDNFYFFYFNIFGDMLTQL